MLLFFLTVTKIYETEFMISKVLSYHCITLYIVYVILHIDYLVYKE